MVVIRYILALIICIPLWFLLVWACTRALDFFISVLDGLDDTIINDLLVKPLAGVFISVVIPTAFLAIGIGLWFLAECIFGLAN